FHLTKLFLRCYSVWKEHQLPLTREFSFIKLDWTGVLRFRLLCGTRSSIYRESIFFGMSGEHILANSERERKSISDGQVLVPSGKSLFPRRLEAKAINEAQRFLTNLTSTREYLENNPLTSLISS
ncbi:unnamed protein product, partial [Pocillopora meandrina]